ncbi:ATP-binding protein [Nocardia sp. NPDC057668]|uniref:ATP-binding protein n=1 Tax=Nocardia sp. NPDC057668 TaxID=3346202 RepID=UPI003671BAD8
MRDGISGSATEADVIGIRVPAELAQLTMLRALAETVALIGDFALDEVTDIRVALDEVATALILGSVPGGVIECDFGYNDNRMSIRVGTVVSEPDALDEGGFGWHVLQTLTDSIGVRTESFDPVAGGFPTVVRFSRRRGEYDERG